MTFTKFFSCAGFPFLGKGPGRCVLFSKHFYWWLLALPPERVLNRRPCCILKRWVLNGGVIVASAGVVSSICGGISQPFSFKRNPFIRKLPPHIHLDQKEGIFIISTYSFVSICILSVAKLRVRQHLEPIFCALLSLTLWSWKYQTLLSIFNF